MASDGQCLCRDGFVGAACENHGHCEGGGACDCAAGRFGPGCARICPGTNPATDCTMADGGCERVCTGNQGNCTSAGACHCDPYHYGSDCAAVCKCNGRGVCTDKLDGSCLCDDGFFGDSCEHVCDCDLCVVRRLHAPGHALYL